MILTYGEVEEFIAEIHDVAPEGRVALKGRLKHFQRLGWPSGTNRGKGSRVSYGARETLSLALAMEMAQLGLQPERIVEQLGMFGRELAITFIDMLYDASVRSRDDPVYLIFDPNALRSMGKPASQGKQSGLKNLICKRSELIDAIQSTELASWSRMALISMTEILNAYVELAKKMGIETPYDGISVTVNEWLAQEDARRSALRRLTKKHYLDGDDT